MRSSGRYWLTTLATALILIGITAFLGMISYRNQQRWDLTANKRHSLAEQTVSVLKDLEEPVALTLFIKDGDPGKEVFLRALELYRYHNDKFEYKLVDPERSPSSAQGYNLDQYAMPVAFFDTAGERRESITGFQTVDTAQKFEELITNALIKVSRGRSKTVYVLSGHGEVELEGEGRRTLTKARAALEDKSYTVKPLPLLGKARVPVECDVLLVLGPIKELDPSELQAVRQYLDGGGRALVCLDPQTSVGLAAAVAQYGITVGDDVVVDFNVLNQLLGGDPLVPIAGGYQDHAITRPLGSTATYFPQARSVSVNAGGPEYTTSEIVMTSPDSLAKTDMRELQEGLTTGKMLLSASDLRGPLALGAVSEWKGEPLLESQDGGDAAAASEPTDTDPSTLETTEEKDSAESEQGRLVVFGDSDFVTDQHFDAMGNSDLFLNSVNWLAQEEDLIAIRPKTMENQPIVLSAVQAQVMFLVPLIVLPSVVLIVGGGVWYRRSKSG